MMTKEEYIARHGYMCPKCRVELETSGGPVEIQEEGFATQDVVCKVCGYSWTDVYMLSDVDFSDEESE